MQLSACMAVTILHAEQSAELDVASLDDGPHGADCHFMT
jgi:hypothetical protein